MKRTFSIAGVVAVLLACGGVAQAGTRPVSVMLWPYAGQATAIAAPPEGCDVPATVDGQAYFEMPTVAAEEGASGTTQIRLDLTASGTVANAQLFSSSGNAWLDAAALRSAHLTRFTAEVAHCTPVSGSYLYDVNF